MTSTVASDLAPASGGAGRPGAPRAALPGWVLAVLLGGGVVVALVNLADPSKVARSVVFNALGVLAFGAGIIGVRRNRPVQRTAWWLIVGSLGIFVLGDIVYDSLVVGLGHSSGYPFADILYLIAYPCFAAGLYGVSAAEFRRDAAIDGAIVAASVSAVIWHWVVTPVINSSSGAPIERIVTVLYPVMDIVLMIAIVHAAFTLTRWRPSVWLLLCGLAIMLIGDTVYVQLVADGTPNSVTGVDALWPIAYVVLAGAALHPSMRDLWQGANVGPAQYSRARMAMLGAALFAAPAVVIIDNGDSTPAVALGAITGLAAILVVWRIARLVADANRSREVISESEARFRVLVQYATDIVSVIAYGGEITYASPAIVDILGRPPEAVIGTNVYDLVHPGDMVTVDKTLDVLLMDPTQPVTFEMRVRNIDGSYRWIQATCTNQIEEPSVGGIVGNFRDIDERKRAAAFSTSETLALEMLLAGRPLPHTFRVLLQGLEDYVGHAHATIRLVEEETGNFRTMAAPTVPDEFTRAVDRCLPTAVLRSEATRRVGPIVINDVASAAAAPVRDLAREHGFLTVWSVRAVSPDDERLVALLDIYLPDDRTPTAAQRAIIERTRDLVALTVDRAAQTHRLGYMALHDNLTGLPNRALLIDRLHHALARLTDRRTMLAVLFIDLDRFKIVNDGLGHDTGDELLVEVGRRLAATVRRQDTVARMGGDEFVVVCEDLAEEHLAEELASRAAEALAEPFALSRAEVSVTASVGIALTRRAADTPSRLLRDADAAMYRAKGRGGARWELFDEAMHTQAVTRLLTERALRQALTQNELYVVYQRQFELLSTRPVSDEALLRWAHPTRGLLMPADFIAVAEETGMIVPIGRWVLEQACAHSSRIQSAPDAPAGVSINISGRNLMRPDYPQLVGRCVEDHGLDPARLCLEISEIALLDDLEVTSEALRALKDLGVRLAIDDFGTGGSSLTYLRQFPFDELKIDSSFIAGVGRSAADDAIVAATIDMAHALGMVVAAEGVETEMQRSRLVELGCDRAQGYLLATPEREAGAPERAEPDAEARPRLTIVKEQSA